MKSSSFTRRRKAFSNTRAAFHSTLLVSHAPHGQVDRSSSHSAGLVGSIKDRHVCHLRERHHPFRVGHVCEVTFEMFPGHTIALISKSPFIMLVSGMPCGRRPTTSCQHCS